MRHARREGEIMTKFINEIPGLEWVPANYTKACLKDALSWRTTPSTLLATAVLVSRATCLRFVHSSLQTSQHLRCTSSVLVFESNKPLAWSSPPRQVVASRLP